MISLKIRDTEIRLRIPYKERERAKALGGKWNALLKCWSFPTSPLMAERIWKEFGSELDIEGPEFSALLIQSGASEAAQWVKVCPLEKLPEVPNEAHPSWGHQRRAFYFARGMDASVLGMHMGTGKSKVTIDLLRTQASVFGHPLRVLILCPANVVPVWPEQILDHWPLGNVHVEALQAGTLMKKRVEAAAFAIKRVEHVAIVVNYDAVWRPALAKIVKSVEWDALILDESHRIKDPKGRASLFCAEIPARRRLALSGTLMPHSPLDIWAQMRAIDPGLLGPSYFAFKNRHVETREIKVRVENPKPDEPDTRVVKKIVGYKHLDELQEKLERVTFMADESVLDLPEVLDIDRPVVMPEATWKRAYAPLRARLVAELAEGKVTPTNALERLLRLQQVTGGFVRNDVAVLEYLDNAKRDALQDIMQDSLDEPLVVFCHFIPDLAAVWEAADGAGRRCFELSGRRKELEHWKAIPDREAPVLAVQIQAGGLGIDLTKARLAVYYSLGFNLGLYAQSRARLHRPGQTRGVVYYHLIAQGPDGQETIDQGVRRALQQRQAVVKAVLDRLR